MASFWCLWPNNAAYGFPGFPGSQAESVGSLVHELPCLDRAADARKSEYSDAWLSMAEDWLRLAVDLDAAEQESEEVHA